MKRMIDNKEFDELKKDVKDVEEHTSDYVITNVVVEDEKVLGAQVKDVENDITYNLVLGSQVDANPELVGGEDELESIKIDETNYKVGGGKQLYQHNICLLKATQFRLFIQLINDNANIMTFEEIRQFIYNNYGINENKRLICIEQDYTGFYHFCGANSTQIIAYGYLPTSQMGSRIESTFDENCTITDTIIPL